MNRPAVFISKEFPGLDFDPAVEKISTDLVIKEDIYKLHFWENEHLNFIGQDKTGNSFVISVLSKPIRPFMYKSLITTAKGYDLFELSAPGDYSLEEAIEKALQKQFQVTFVSDPAFPSDFLMLEQKHQQKRTTMKIGVVYCCEGQTNPQDMFNNGRGNDACSDTFWKFVDLLGDPISIDDNWRHYRGDVRAPGLAYYKKWRDIQIIYHVCPTLNDEEIRRLIGNDIGMLIFLEENATSFDPSEIDKFGEVPQAFAVIQPVKDKFRIGFCRKKNLIEHPPAPPLSLIDASTARDIILTKLYNGLVMTNYCPPMNRLFHKPRQDTLESIIGKYPSKTLKKKPSTFVLNQKLLPGFLPAHKKSLSIEDGDTVTFIYDAEKYSPINSLVLLVASNIAYEEPEQIKELANQHLGFQIERVLVLREKVSDGVLYIAADPQKIFIIFRGMTDIDKEKKILSRGKKAKFQLRIKKQDISLPGEIFSKYVETISVMYEKLDEILDRWFFKGTMQQLYLAGHDTGGAMAILVAHLLSFNYRDIAGVYAFGSPKVGDSVWSKSYPDWLADKTYRIIHQTDYVWGLPPNSQGWAHVGHQILLEGTTTAISEPHLLESYFKSLIPAHKAAVGEAADRISMKSQKILQGINYRETIRLKNFNVDDLKQDSSFSENEGTTGTDPTVTDQNARYELPQRSNLVRVSTGTIHETEDDSNPSSSQSLVAPNILQQIRNNVFVLISHMKTLRAMIFEGAPGDFASVLALVNTPMKNLMIIVGLIVSQETVVRDLVGSIGQFLQVADGFFRGASDNSVSLESVKQSWEEALPLAKTVAMRCEKLKGK